MRELTGGFNNLVYEHQGRVIKEYLEGDRSGVTPTVRRHQERRALKVFGGSIAPAFLGMMGDEIYIQYVEGTTADHILQEACDKPRMFYDMGRYLDNLHKPTHKSPVMIQDKVEKRIKQAHEAEELLHAVGQPYFEPTYNLGELARYGVVYVHGDASPSNFMVGDKMIMLDWEHSTWDTPYVDLTMMELFGFRNPRYGILEGTRQAFYEGYGRDLDENEIREQTRLRAYGYIASTRDRFVKNYEKGAFFENHLVKTLQEL